MRNNLRFILATVATLASTLSFAAGEMSPAGYWKTIDDVTGEAKSIVEISMQPNQTLQGKVSKLFHNPDKKCTECTDTRKDQPVLGMVVMQGLKHSNSERDLWQDGEILDPKNGKIYRCNIQLVDNNQLIVRGYLGIPLFGRSQTWVRVKNAQ